MLKAKITQIILLSLLAVGIVTVSAPAASADVFQLNILNCNCLPNGTSAGTVTLTTFGTNAVDFAVHLNSPLNFHDTNAFDAFAFSYTGAGALSASNITSGFTFFTTAQGSGSMNGAGHSFEFFLDYTDAAGTGGNTGVTDLAFRITSTVAVTLAQFETLNGDNNADFAASVSNTGQSGCTGVVSGGNGTGASTPSGGISNRTDGLTCGGTVQTPEPSSTMTLGLGLLILGLASRKFMKKVSQEG